MPTVVNASGRLPDHPRTRWPPDTQLYRPYLTLTHLIQQRLRLEAYHHEGHSVAACSVMPATLPLL